MPLTETQQILVDEARRRGMDPALALALGDVESSFNPSAVSPTGVTGLLQVTNKTGAPYGQTPETRRDPQVSASAGLGYLADLMSQHGSPEAALARYNTTDPQFTRKVMSRVPQYQQMLAGTAQPGSLDDLEQRHQALQARPGPAPPTTGTLDDLERRHQALQPSQPQTPRQGPTVADLQGKDDRQILTAMGFDPQEVMSSRFYSPGVFANTVKNRDFQGVAGQIGYGVASQVGQAAELGARLAQSPAATRYFEARNQLDRLMYQSEPKSLVVGGIDVPEAAGSMLPMTAAGIIAGPLAAAPKAYKTLSALRTGGRLFGEGVASGILQPGEAQGPQSTEAYTGEKVQQGLVGGAMSLGSQILTRGGQTLSTLRRNTAPRAGEVSQSLKEVAEGLPALQGTRKYEAVAQAINSLRPGKPLVTAEEAQGLDNLLRHMNTLEKGTEATKWIAGGLAALTGLRRVPTGIAGAAGIADYVLSHDAGRSAIIAAAKEAPGSAGMDAIIRALQASGTGAWHQP